MRVAGGAPASSHSSAFPSSVMASTSPAALPVLEVHTPQSSFAVVHSCKPWYSPSVDSTETEPATCTVQGDTIQSLYTKLQKKAGEESIGYVVGAGWVKYEWNGSFWDLDDGKTRGAFLRSQDLEY